MPIDKAGELLSALWFLFIAVGFVSFLIAAMFRSTRGDTWKESLIAPAILYSIYSAAAVGVSIQGWSDIRSSVYANGSSYLHFLWPVALGVLTAFASWRGRSLEARRH